MEQRRRGRWRNRQQGARFGWAGARDHPAGHAEAVGPPCWDTEPKMSTSGEKMAGRGLAGSQRPTWGPKVPQDQAGWKTECAGRPGELWAQQGQGQLRKQTLVNRTALGVLPGSPHRSASGFWASLPCLGTAMA